TLKSGEHFMHLRIDIAILAACTWLACDCLADQKSAEDVLKANGLTRVGSLYLLEGDAKLADGLREMRRAESAMQAYTTKRQRYEAEITKTRNYIIQLAKEKVSLNDSLTRVNQN